MVIPSRIIKLPIAFEDSETKKAVEKYLQLIRPDAPNCEGGYNLEYIAECNGVTVKEAKEKLMGTECSTAGAASGPAEGFFGRLIRDALW